jgi:transcriptional regulator with XRE-family HTH domain
MARAGAGLTLRELADAAEVSPSTVDRFEKSKGSAIAATANAIQRALEAAGIEFGDGGWVRYTARD